MRRPTKAWASTALDDWGDVVVAGNGGDPQSGYPAAFVNLIAFDKNFNYLGFAYDKINGGEQTGETKIAHDHMTAEYVATEEGYIFAYVSNENATLVEVYFDDVKMTHAKSKLIQSNEYYPFGMNTASSWTRENATGNNFLANSGTELNQTSSLYDLVFRNYDPVIGRLNGVDPMAGMYPSISPYHFALNNPTGFSDPSGAVVENDGIDKYGSIIYAMDHGWSPESHSIVMDPASRGMDGVWNPVEAGGYGVAGRWFVPDFMAASNAAAAAANQSNTQRQDHHAVRDGRMTQSEYDKKHGAWYERWKDWYRDRNDRTTYIGSDFMGYVWKDGFSKSKLNSSKFIGFGSTMQSPLTQVKVDELFGDSFARDFVPSVIGSGYYPGLSPAARLDLIGKLLDAKDKTLLSKEGNRVLGIVAIEIYEADESLRSPSNPTGKISGTHVTLWTSPDINYSSTIFDNPGMNRFFADYSLAKSNGDLTQYRINFKWQEPHLP